MQFPGFIRPASSGDIPAIDALLKAAFGGSEEVALVHALRRDGAIRGEQVIPLGDEIIGYYALSAMKSPAGWLCLAPVAIAPGWQGRGHGRRLVSQLAFYAKAGFVAAAAAALTSPYPVAQTLLAGAGGKVPPQKLIYPAAFGKGPTAPKNASA